MTKSQFLEKYPDISEGMHVYGENRQFLGRIIDFSDHFMTIEKGVFFPKNFNLRYEDVLECKEGEISVNKTLDELRAWTEESYEGWDQVEDINVGKMKAVPSDTFRPHFETLKEEVVTVPLFEEELDAKKLKRQTGEVRVRKIVHSELKHVTVPIDHEEVRVEHIAIDRREANEVERQKAFEETAVSMPVMDEEIELAKRTVVREELRLKKVHKTEERDVSGEVRKEDVEIQDETQTKRKAG